MRTAERILQFSKLALLCIAALNTACWTTARLRHELRDHSHPRVCEHAPGVPLVSHSSEIHHGPCTLCELFRHLHPHGTGNALLSWVPELLLSGLQPVGPHRMDCEPIPGWPVRAPPYFS